MSDQKYLKVPFVPRDGQTCSPKCPFMWTRRFGTVFFCHLFQGDDGELKDELGCPSGEKPLVRLQACIDAEIHTESTRTQK